ncbi:MULTISPECIES: sacsin N-terminal ATP-binding-like domain-containing protein [Leeuwenhoekiella]|jgi:hypothetical protein|uniref:sacsin N-terminal ATP-binding-like domain-containing protein n=1 Tax=Leeuwenhoekiella TaxID=283735 RepID=UPI000C4CB277|nr:MULTISPECIES: hypothetical protein [Leeuwenhoekiella]MAO45164.1 ATP-binding protein [Leeuwenhoekiella sp.]MBQ51199.1 ATP-binding protein [Leeuwenhoekiella sp.]HAB27385.1 ATP-binding protein [Xanthomarina gelatinilytica]HAI19278.1 ATP-binding protein [Xanthomarina gelatinilytica]|tara:strand:- start:3538 stop:6084 length:2547 start_codon:yes stop_codon:yes gene_type:complete
MIQSIEEGRKEDGNRSIADKINKRLHDLDKTVENNKGRWAWELLQNAKDSIADYPERKISIQIEHNNDNIIFRHNGIYFTERDIRGIINQISSKETEEGETSTRTGRFGTGFLTTHLLSREIDIEGILETDSLETYQFKFPLDRRGNSMAQLMPKVENAWTEFQNSVKLINSDYNEFAFNTSFTYHLNTDEQKEIAKVGVNEFVNLIPYVLTFISKIDKVEIINNLENEKLTFTSKQNIESQNLQVIEKIYNGQTSIIHILKSSSNRTSIAAEVLKKDDGYYFQSLDNVPSLFCDFPMIGTEDFHFPMVVNSFYFNPLTERDGIWLKKDDDKEVQENREILLEALELYKNLMDTISTKTYFNLFYVSDSRMPKTLEKFFDRNWYEINVQKPIRDILWESTIVEIENSKEKFQLKDIWFPEKKYKNEIQKKLWKFTYDLFPKSVCKKQHIAFWVNIGWNDWQKLDYVGLVKDVEEQESIDGLSKALEKSEEDTFQWFNDFGNFIMEIETNNILFNKHKVLPNYNGTFCFKEAIHIDKIKDPKLLEILELLGEDWKNLLLHPKVGFGKYKVKNLKNIADEISNFLKHSKKNNEDEIKAISLLSEWFEANTKDSKEYFSHFYGKRAELFMNTISDKESLYKVMRSSTDLEQLSNMADAINKDPDLINKFNQAEEFSNLLNEYNVTNIEELKLVLENSKTHHIKAEITQEDLAGLGVTSMDELEEALKDRDLAALFNHTSRPNANMFLYAQQLIERSKQNIIEYLISHKDYDCTDIDELATTVLGGIKKNNVDVHIVIRPSDSGQVIVFYSSEKDTLDYANAELWIDNGKERPRHLTLGTILKTTGINKIPV